MFIYSINHKKLTSSVNSSSGFRPNSDIEFHNILTPILMEERGERERERERERGGGEMKRKKREDMKIS